MPAIVAGQTDTLRFYDTRKQLANSSGNIDMRIARFELSGPISLHGFSVLLDGVPDTFTVRIFGHEGGTSFPQLREDLIPPVKGVKSTTGKERVSIPLDTVLVLRNNQFFVAIEDLGSTTHLRQSVATLPPTCTSSSGGNYYYQSFLNNGSWSLGSRAFAIDVVCRKHDLPETPHFTNITETAKIIGNGNQLAAADINNDGLIDILQGGKLLLNDWWKSKQFNDVTEASGISGNPKANALIDMNNDGYLDILFLGAGDSSFVFINDGTTNFARHHLKGIKNKALERANAVSFADLNNDGYLDMFVGQLWNTYPNALPKFLFFNTQKNDFSDKSDLLYSGAQNLRNAPCRGSQFADINNDGCLDLYVVNYVTTASKTTSPRDELWLNNGDGSFTNIIDQTGIDSTIGPTFWNMSSGCHWGDYDNDGDIDLLASTLSHPRFMNGNGGEYTEPTTLYRNLFMESGKIAMKDEAGSHGIEYEETHAGATWGDYNNDGLLDFFIASFYGCRYNDLYRQLPDQTFQLTSFENGFNGFRGGADGIWLDINNDGKLDLLSAGQLMLNTGPYYGDWIELQPKSSGSNLFAVGARVTVYANKTKFTRDVTIGRGQNMQRPFRLHFGLGHIKSIDSVRVSWPGCSGKTSLFTNLSKNNVYVLEENGQATLSTDKAEDHTIAIYPNPSTGDFTIVTTAIITDITVVDSRGNRIPITLTKQGESCIVHLPESAAPGIYILNGRTASNLITRRLIKLDR
ncbi:MAG: VCBS repeat-containing protein [Bacteroidia bacterium]|nr:VCBS repeat-containing protein [Bacteroidia bacterium]